MNGHEKGQAMSVNSNDSRPAPLRAVVTPARLTGVAVAAAALVTGGAVLASEAAPTADTGAIHACVNKKTRVLTVRSSCPSGTTPLVWNKTGPQGPAGESGWGTAISGPEYRFSQPEAIVFDGAHMWVANSHNNSVTEVTASNGRLVRNVHGGAYDFSQPEAIGYGGGRIWVPNSNNNSLTELNASTGSFIRNLSGSTYDFSTPATATATR